MSFEALNFSITLVLTPQEEVDDLHFRHFPAVNYHVYFRKFLVTVNA